MNKQEIFDKAVGGVIRQGGPATANDNDNEMACQYRAGDRKCALGHLIPDGMYHPGMENKTALSLFESYPDVAIHIMGEGWDAEVPKDTDAYLFGSRFLISQLQGAHDSAARHAYGNDDLFMERFVEQTKRISNLFILKWNF